MPLPPPSPLPLVTLEGHFVRLEPLALTHVPALLGAANGPRDTYGLTNVPSDEASMRAYVEEAMTRHTAGDALAFATIDLRGAVSAPRVVGSTRFGNAERWSWPFGHVAERPVGIDAVEIGWTWLTASAQRTAINSEAKLLMLGHAFEQWQIERMTLKTDARNMRSRNAIERIGGKLDGILRAHMPSYTGVRGDIRHTAFFSILRAEWPAAKARLQAFVAVR